jgi:hypothetical protein
MTGFIGRTKIGDQENGFLILALPPGQRGHWAILFAGNPNVGQTDQIARLKEQIAKGKELIVFIHLCIFGGAAAILAFLCLQSRLQLNPVELAIPQEDHLRMGWQNVMELTEEFMMDMFRQMPFTAFHHQLSDRQRPFAIQQTDHQGEATLSYLAAIDNKHHLSDFGQAIEQFLEKRQVIAFIIHSLILDPAAVALNPTICFGPIRRFSGNRRQLAALSHDDPVD